MSLRRTPKKIYTFSFISLIGFSMMGCGGQDGGAEGDAVAGDEQSTQLSIGNGTSTDFQQGVLAASSTTLQAGASVTISANIVDNDNAPYVEPLTIEFSSGCVSTGVSSFADTSVSTAGGLASTVYTAEGCNGTDTVTAQAVFEGQIFSASIDLDIAQDVVLGVEFVSNSDSVLSIAGIGGDETSDVTFKIVGAQGAPIVGELVTFELSNTTGGATLAGGTESGLSNSEGNVSTVVQSGTVNSSLRVIATHSGTGTQGFSDDISISTGVPVSRTFDLSYTPHNPDAWTKNQVEVTITANVSDQYGNSPPDGTRVSFRSVEAGIVEPSCELVDGTCTVTWVSSGDRNSITPDTLDRSGRITVLGFMSGAEDFTDFNANGLFDTDSTDEASSVVDLPEAFTDQNEDGQYNFGEDFVDSFLNDPAPGDGQSGGLNGTYDAVGDSTYNGPCSVLINNDCPVTELQSTTISDSVVIVMSSPSVQFCDMGSLPALGTNIDTPFTMTNVVLCDINGNSLPVSTRIEFLATGLDILGVGSFEVPSDTTEPAGPFGLSLFSDGDLTGNPSFSIQISVPDNPVQLYTWLVNET